MAKRKPVSKEEEPTSDEEVEYVEVSDDGDDVEEVEDDDEEEEVEGEDEEEEEEVEEEGGDDEEEETDDASKRDSVRKLLEPFGKDQLLEILKEAALKNKSIIDRVLQSAETDTTHRKIFVHGLGWDCTTQTLLAEFTKYGEVEDGNVITDKVTNKSKGYGFVLFKTREGACKALKEPEKKIGNRMAACQLASLGPVANNPVAEPTGRKIYVTNVAPSTTAENLRAFFAQYGEIEDGPTGKLRGFAIYVYKTPEGCKKALEQPVKLFEGYQLQCKRAIEGFSKKPGEAIAAGVGQSPFPAANFPINYPMGFNPAMMGQTLSLSPAAASLMGQSTGIGHFSSAALTASGYSPSVVGGLSPSTGRNEAASAYGLQSSINSFSPSVIGNYGSQAALQGLGAYQNAQLGQSSASALARSQSGIGSLGTMSSYLGR